MSNLEKHVTKVLNLEETESKRADGYADRYNFISPLLQFVFPKNCTTIEKFNNTKDRFERSEILLDIKGGDSHSEK